MSEGLKLRYDIYAGFDTEYENIDSTTNKLISTQVKVSNRIILGVPDLARSFDFESFNIGEGRFYNTYLRDEPNKEIQKLIHEEDSDKGDFLGVE
jgi:hypothetical protein